MRGGAGGGAGSSGGYQPDPGRGASGGGGDADTGGRGGGYGRGSTSNTTIVYDGTGRTQGNTQGGYIPGEQPPGDPPKPGMVWDPKRGWITPGTTTDTTVTIDAPSWQNHWGRSPGEGRSWTSQYGMGTVANAPSMTQEQYTPWRNQMTGFGVPPAGGNPWANWANSALSGMQGGMNNAQGKWGSSNQQMPSIWQGMGNGLASNTMNISQNKRPFDHISMGTNPWAGTNYIRRPGAGGRVPR